MNRALSIHDQIDMLREENRQLREQIKTLRGQDVLMRVMRTFKLSPQQGRLFCMLLHRGECEKSDLLEGCWSPDKMLDVDEGVRSAIKHIRRKLERFGMDIETVYGLGYAMSEENRRRARELMGAE